MSASLHPAYEMPRGDATVVPLRDRSIGAILVDAGRLRADDADRILREQRARDLRFGDAGLALGLLTPDDIKFAIARQHEHAVLPIGDPRIDADVIAAFRPGHFTVEALRQVRTQILLRWLDAAPARKCVAVIGSGTGVGRSYVAANLAVLFAQLGERTLLVDGDLRNPSHDRLFRLRNASGLSTVLSDRAGVEAVQSIEPLPNLAVLTAGPGAPNPQELLSRPAFSRFLDAARASFDVVLVDTPSWDVGADAQVIAARAGATIVVARQDHTNIRAVAAIAAALRDSGTHLIGSVVNRF